MIICGVKITHDGGVALIDNGRLVFSVEMEKLSNNPRHQGITDLSVVFDLLDAHGYRPGDVDRFVVDGWRKTHKLRLWGGQEVALDLAPYRRGLLDADPLRPFPGEVLDLAYTSYPHYAGHVASAYCSSPFARAAEPSYVLCWDGAMFPFLYHYDPGTGRLESLGALFHMLGDTYHTLAQLYPPFDAPIEWPHTLALPGKIMAYIALGRPDRRAVKALAALQRAAEHAVLGDGPLADHRLTERAGRRILALMREGLSVPGVAPQDMIASIHAFLGRTLVDRLAERIDADGERTGNLCLVGGCALNIKWNRDIRESGVARHVWIPPFPNDAGSALGTACCELLRASDAKYLTWDAYAGPPLEDRGIPDGWTASACPPAGLAGRLHRDGEPVLVLHGPAELGPRALGHRSIVAAAVDPAMKRRLNDVKDREDYRPVAPICLEARAPEIFSPGVPDPYMLFDHDVREPWRSRIPAVCHLDGTARIQTVGAENDPTIFELLTEYERLSGIPVLCNTSANLKGSGFFPDLRSAMEWGRVPAVWSDGTLYEKR